MEDAVLKASEQFPVVMVCGQRQTGKSIMLRHIAGSDGKYVGFDDARACSSAKTD